MNLSHSGESVNVTFPPVEPSDNTTEHFINISAALYTSILSIIGSIGNMIVLYVYIFKSKQNAFNTFIIFLALFDVAVSLIAMPLDVLNVVLSGAFQGCKPLVIIATTNALATAFILLAIAVLRFKGICQPLEPNISVVQARRISLISLGIAVAISWPSVVMVTNMPNELKGGMVVITCASDSYFKTTIYPVIFNGILFLLFVLEFISLVVLYGIIGRRLWLRTKYGPSFSSVHKDKCVKHSNHSLSTEMSQSVSEDTINSEETNIASTICSANSEDQSSTETEITYDYKQSGEPSSATKDTSQSNSGETSEYSAESNVPKEQIIELECESCNTTISYRSVSQFVATKKKTSNVSKTQNTLKMLFIVTFTFLLSYVPHLSLMLYEAVGSDLDVTPLGESFVGIIIRSFLINSSSNPIIYGFCSKLFRDETSAIFQRMKKCLHIG